MHTEVEMQGDQLAKSLQKRLEGMQGAAAARAVAKGCQLVVKTAKKYVPEDTKHLRRSITFRVEMDGTDVVGKVGTQVHYAIHVEYGHRTRSATTNTPGKIKYVLGTYFLTRALRENRDEVRGMITAELLKSAKE